jgi:hypothetical protein
MRAELIALHRAFADAIAASGVQLWAFCFAISLVIAASFQAMFAVNGPQRRGSKSPPSSFGRPKWRPKPLGRSRRPTPPR